jgi:hypothetical protein
VWQVSKIAFEGQISCLARDLEMTLTDLVNDCIFVAVLLFLGAFCCFLLYFPYRKKFDDCRNLFPNRKLRGVLALEHGQERFKEQHL